MMSSDDITIRHRGFFSALGPGYGNAMAMADGMPEVHVLKIGRCFLDVMPQPWIDANVV